MSSPQLNLKPLSESFSLNSSIYKSLKSAIKTMNIYDEGAELRLDERKLSEQLGISRTPLREALARLDQEGLVKIIPRRGVFIVRKNKAEILEMITVWAALESMAARLITQHASDKDIARLRKLVSDFHGDDVSAHLDEYSEMNIKFHEAIIGLSGNQHIIDIIESLFMHVRAIRARTIHEADRAYKSIVDHEHIIDALERRETELAERLVREHTLNLRKHVEENVALE
jgi:DNA-binding GntR family transcriptional regulator